MHTQEVVQGGGGDRVITGVGSGASAVFRYRGASQEVKFRKNMVVPGARLGDPRIFF